MRKQWLYGPGLALVALAFPAQAAPIPEPVAAMIKAAAASGDAATLKTTADLAKKTNPDSVAEIDAMVAGLQQSAEDQRLAKLRTQGFFEGWHGQGQAGASISTGNTSSKGFALGIDLHKEGVKWRHAILGTVDYSRQNGVTSQERYFASYEANYKLTERLYALGLVSWERDAFAGFSRRFSETVGIGYAALKRPNMTLNVEAGPALRQTRYITGLSANRLAARGALDYSWTIRPGMVFTEVASLYAESDDSTLTSTTALTLKMLDALSLRASLLVDHETHPPLGLEKTNTTSRLTLVYGF